MLSADVSWGDGTIFIAVAFRARFQSGLNHATARKLQYAVAVALHVIAVLVDVEKLSFVTFSICVLDDAF